MSSPGFGFGSISAGIGGRFALFGLKMDPFWVRVWGLGWLGVGLQLGRNSGFGVAWVGSVGRVSGFGRSVGWVGWFGSVGCLGSGGRASSWVGLAGHQVGQVGGIVKCSRSEC